MKTQNGKLVMLSVDELLIDNSYQRDVVSKTNTQRIANELNMKAFGALIVMQRADGTKYVIDGQQRLSAIKLNNEIKRVPCILFMSDGISDEARVFLTANTNRKHVLAVDKFKAAVNAMIEPQLEINNWLLSNGLYVTKDSDVINGVCFPHNLIRTWKIDKNATQKSIVIQRLINENNEPLSSQIHKGIWWLLRSGVEVSEHVNRIVSKGGRRAMLKSIKYIAIETGCKEDYRICGAGILRLINKGLHKKIKTTSIYE